MTTPNFSDRARELVRDCINAKMPEGAERLSLDDVFVVWFCKTLRNWKALVSTTLPNAAYYEVTHNGATGETYIDVYVKINQIISTPVPGADQ